MSRKMTNKELYQSRLNWIDEFTKNKGRKPNIIEVSDNWDTTRSATYTYLKRHGLWSMIDQRRPIEIEIDERIEYIREELLRIRRERGFVFRIEIFDIEGANNSLVYELPEDIINITTPTRTYQLAHRLNKTINEAIEYEKEYGEKPNVYEYSELKGFNPESFRVFFNRNRDILGKYFDIRDYNKK